GVPDAAGGGDAGAGPGDGGREPVPGEPALDEPADDDPWAADVAAALGGEPDASGARAPRARTARKGSATAAA
ncbi:MAG: hypothetical protein ACI38P_05070, partial [Cellulosimicrobium funkei]